MRASEADKPDSGAGPTATVSAAASAGQTATRAQVPRPAVQGLLAFAAYLAVFIAGYALPLVRHPGLPQVGQAVVDPNFYIWSWRWWPYAISHGLNPLYSHQIGVPAGYGLAWTTSTPAVAVILSPVTVAFGPITSFNLTLVLGAPLSAWAAFLAARRLTAHFWAALVAGAVYGFSWYEVAETGAGHPNLSVILLLPLMLYLALLWRDGKLGSRSFVGLMAVAMAAEFYVYNETFAEMTVLWAAGLLIGFVVARPADRPIIARLAKLAGLAYVVAIVLAAPYLIYALRHAPARFTKVQPAFSLNLEQLVVPRSGIVLLLIVLALAVLTWSSSRLTRLLIILFVLIIAAAIGPSLMVGTVQLGSVPWARLWYLPIVRSAEPLRIMIFGYLVLANIAAVWLAAPTKSRLLLVSRWILGLAAAVAIIGNLPAGSRGYVIPASVRAHAASPADALPAFISTGLYRDYLRPGETVVVVSDRGNAGVLFQAETNFYFRIGGGFVNRSFTATDLPAPVAALSHPTPARKQQFRAYVHQAGVGAILVEQAWAEPWMRVFSRMGLHGTQVGGMIVYRTA
jgi:hypothetical protein